MVNSLNDTQIGVPANNTQISYFLLVFNLLARIKYPKAPEKGGLSSKAITFVNDDFLKEVEFIRRDSFENRLCAFYLMVGIDSIIR